MHAEGASFVSGLQLCERFYGEAVRPIIDTHFPDLTYTAALIGPGSEVLGYDDAMSTDHDWGPRCQIFLEKPDYLRLRPSLHEVLVHQLPYQFGGYSTHFSPPDETDNGTQVTDAIHKGPINHRVEIVTAARFVWQTLGVDLDDPLDTIDWLTFSEQRLLSITAGRVFHDGIGLRAVRDRFAYFPRDVWLYLMAATWGRIGQEEHLMGRAGLAGDELGSAVTGARLVRDVMRLSFLQARRYAPYPKWLGTAFRELAVGAVLYPVLQQVLTATDWETRQALLVSALEVVAKEHNRLGVTRPMPEKGTVFFNRPFQVMAFHGFDQALLGEIEDDRLRRLGERPLLGGIDQISDHTSLLSHAEWRVGVKRLFDKYFSFPYSFVTNSHLGRLF